MQKNKLIRQEIWQAVNHLSDEQLNQQEAPDRWSIAQILDHLYLLELHIAEKMEQVVKLEDTPTPEPKSLGFVLDRSHPRKVPAHATPTAEFQTLDSLKDKLNKSRGYLTDVLEGITPDELEQKSMLHSLGDMSLKQWVEFIGLHELRHLEQIKETKQRLSF